MDDALDSTLRSAIAGIFGINEYDSRSKNEGVGFLLAPSKRW